MLIKDTQGRVLTDVHGRPMTTKDRWHPLVVSFVKRVNADGGEIITPAIEEMNEMAWAGKFDDALYVYFAGARKAGKTYALIPNDGSGDLEVERDSAAMEWNKKSLLSNVGNDVCAINFNPATKILEGSRKQLEATNLFLESENFSNGYWNNNTAINIVSENNISPTGQANATHVTANGSNSYLARTHFPTTDEEVVFSVFAKKGAAIWLRLNYAAALDQGSWFNLDSGTIGSVFGGNTATIKDVGKGWYRCSVYFPSANAGSSNSWVIGICSADGTTTAPPNGDGFYVFGAQFQKANFLSSYIPTNGAIATRLADDIEDIAVPMGATEIRAFVDGVETVIDSDLPATWEFPENSTTKYVIIK